MKEHIVTIKAAAAAKAVLLGPKGVYLVNSSSHGLIGPQKPQVTSPDRWAQRRHIVERKQKKSQDSFCITGFISYKNIAQKSGYSVTERVTSVAASKPICTEATYLLHRGQELGRFFWSSPTLKKNQPAAKLLFSTRASR